MTQPAEASLDTIQKHLKAKDANALADLLLDPQRQVRVAAAQALGQLGRRKSIPALVGAMGDDQVQVRRAAAQALADMGQPAVPPLIATLEGQGGRQAPYALWALGEIGGPAATEALIESATTSSEWEVRWSATESLGDVGGERAVEALIQVSTDRDERIRTAAARGLHRYGDAAVPDLAQAMRHGEKSARQTIRAILREINTPAAQAALRREQLFFWVPVVAIGIGITLVVLWFIVMALQ